MRKALQAALSLLLVLGAGVLVAETVGTIDKQVLELAEPILDNILEAYKTYDYEGYVRDFDDTAREALNKETFVTANTQMRSILGEYKGRKYLGFINKGEMTVVLWKGVFGKTTDDVLIKLVLSKRGEKVLVVGLWFQ